MRHRFSVGRARAKRTFLYSAPTQDLQYDDKLIRTQAGWRIERRDYTTFMVDGDDRMTFGGRAPDWGTDYR